MIPSVATSTCAPPSKSAGRYDNSTGRSTRSTTNGLLATRAEGKDEVRQEIQNLEPPTKADGILKDPYVLDFLDLNGNSNYLETDLEQALMDKLQQFLLELGKGFSFVARQQRVSADGDHYYIDLVFYHYVLKCFVLIDLKTGKLTPRMSGRWTSTFACSTTNAPSLTTIQPSASSSARIATSGSQVFRPRR